MMTNQTMNMTANIDPTAVMPIRNGVYALNSDCGVLWNL